ncbi:hypothetical protein NQZ68_001950 [Dissostichus eleginoides]|nr:hypothetical protein NQZ68_001950 [Dissostichus eleginoides]
MILVELRGRALARSKVEINRWFVVAAVFQSLSCDNVQPLWDLMRQLLYNLSSVFRVYLLVSYLFDMLGKPQKEDAQEAS